MSAATCDPTSPPKKNCQQDRNREKIKQFYKDDLDLKEGSYHIYDKRLYIFSSILGTMPILYLKLLGYPTPIFVFNIKLEVLATTVKKGERY